MRNLKVKVKSAKGRSVSSTRWLQRQLNDPFVKEAKLQGFRSRSAFKLLEIDNKFKIIKNGIKIVDLGSAPGSWSQYLSEKSKNSMIMSIDLKEVDVIKNVNHLIGDFLDEQNQVKINNFFLFFGDIYSFGFNSKYYIYLIMFLND